MKKPLKIRFEAIDEPLPGVQSQAWIARDSSRTRSWYRSALADGYRMPTPKACRRRIAESMPELLVGYDAACALIPDHPMLQVALSEADPPPLIPAGCTVRALPGSEPALVRNYDFHPDATSGVIVRSHWRDRTLLGMGEGVIGYLDAMNDRGLAGAITLGGRHIYGRGFGVLLILRWLLEVADDVAQACEAVRSVPCAWSQNLLLLDAGGRGAVVQLSPDREHEIFDDYAVTNHQAPDEGAENSHMRLASARALAGRVNSIVEGFLEPPLFGCALQDWMATLYTAEYAPLTRSVTFHWPSQPSWQFAMDRSESGDREVNLPQA